MTPQPSTSRSPSPPPTAQRPSASPLGGDRAPAARGPGASSPEPGTADFEMVALESDEARHASTPAWHLATPPRSLMSTAASDALAPLRQRAASPEAARAEALARVLADFREAHPNTSLTALIGCDFGRLLRRNAWVAGPTGVGCLMGFLMGIGFTTEAGFNLLVPVPSEPFNHVGAEHRGEAAALVGWTLSAGIGLAIGLGKVGRAVGAAASWRWARGRQAPASPLADLMLAETGRLYRRHQAMVACTMAVTLCSYLITLGLGGQAGFNFLRNIPSPPFNPEGIPDRTRAGWLLGWNLSLAVLVAAPVGALVGATMGRGVRRLQRQLASD